MFYSCNSVKGKFFGMLLYHKYYFAGTLHFLNVELSDQSTSAVPYACGINNDMMKAFYKGGNVIMPVNRGKMVSFY